MTVPARWGPWALSGLVLVVFAPTLANGFTNWDDPTYAQGGPFVSLGWSGVWAAFTKPYEAAYAPLTHALLVVLHQVGGGSPLPFHMAQWVMWGVTAALLPRALQAVSVTGWVALAAAALWLVHPFRVESVSWVANTKDTLSTVLVVSAFAAYGAQKRFLALMLFFVALLAKASVVPLCIVFGVLEWRRGARSAAVAFVVPSVVFGVLALAIHRAFVSSAASWAWQTALVTPWWYLGRTLYPVESRAVYDWVLPGLLSGVGLASLLGWCATIGLSILSIRRVAWRSVAWGLAIALLTLAPFSGLVPQRFVVAERYSLWPSLVLAVGVASLLVRLERWRWATLFGLLGALVSMTVLRQREWRDGITLWESNVAIAPTAFAAQYNYAGALGGVGRFTEAYAALQRARDRMPRYPNLDCALAMARAGKEQVDATWATQALPEVCALKPEARWEVAQPLLKQRDPRARIILEELDLGPKRAQAAATSAALALEQNDPATALALARLALSWQPSFEPPLVTQALALLQMNQAKQVLELTERTFADPRIAARLMGVRATALYQLGQTEEAGRLLQQSVSELRRLGESLPY
jgi:protein O-mannosyl-transferase